MAINTRERRRQEICDSFDYFKYMALDMIEKHYYTNMEFRLVFNVEGLPELSHDITEYFVTDTLNEEHSE